MGALRGSLAEVGAGTLRLGLGVVGAGMNPGARVLERRDLRFEPGPQLGLVPGGLLAGRAFPSCCRPMTALNSVRRISSMPVPSSLRG